MPFRGREGRMAWPRVWGGTRNPRSPVSVGSASVETGPWLREVTSFGLFVHTPLRAGTNSRAGGEAGEVGRGAWVGPRIRPRSSSGEAPGEGQLAWSRE